MKELIQKIAQKHLKRTGNKCQIGSVEKVLKELMPDVVAVLKEDYQTVRTIPDSDED